MFKAFTLYFFVTLSVFFGYTHLFKPATQPTKPGDTQAYEMKPFQEFMANMMSFENIDTDFNLSLENSEMTLSAEGNVVFEIEDSALALDVNLVYNNEVFDVQAKYLQPNFYLEINENVYKFDASTSGGEIDFDALMNFATETIGLDLSALSSVGDALGIDFETFDINEFVAKVTDPEYKKIDSGHRFIFNISNVITAVLDCDENYNIASARVNDIMIKGNAIKFNISNTRMNQPDINVSYGETGDEIDMTGLTEYIGYTQNTFENPYVEADVDILVDGESYAAKVYYQNDEKLQVKVETEIEGVKIELVYSDDVIYIDAAGQKISFNIDDYPAWEKEINTIVENQTGKGVGELINDFATTNFGQDVADMTTQQQVMAVLGALFGNSDKIDAFLPDDTLQTESDFTMLWNNGLNIKLTKNDDLISNVLVSYDNVTAVANLKLVDNGFSIVGEYYDLTNLLPLMPIADEILTAEQFGGKATVTIDGEEVVADYRVQFASDMLAEIKLEVMGEEIAVYLSGRDVYVQVGELVISGSLDEENLNGYIARVMAMLGKETESEDATDGNRAEVKNVVEQVADILSGLKLSSEEGKLAVIEYLLNTGHIFIAENNVVKVHVESGAVQVDLTATATSTDEIKVPAATDTAADMLTKAENVKALVESEQYGFEFEVKYVLEETAEAETTETSEEVEYISVTGTAQVDVKNGIYAVTNLSALGYTIERVIYVESENVVYVTYLGNKIQASVTSGMSIAEVVMPIVKANMPESEVTEETEASKTTEEQLSEVLVEVFGKDVSALTLKEHLKNLSVNVEREVTVGADSLTFTGAYGVKQDDESVKSVTANVEIGFAGNNVSSVEVNVEERVNVKASMLAFATPEFNKEEYYNVTSGHKGQITVAYTDGTESISFVADVEVDLRENVYVKATATIAGNGVELLVRENRFTLSVGEFRVGAYFSDAAEIWESVKALLPASEESEEEVTVASVEEQESICNLTGSKVTLNAIEVMQGLTISGYLEDEKSVTQVKFADEIENSTVVVYDVSEFLPKVEYIKNYIEAGVYGFAFDFSYNGFPFEGTFKYSNGEMAIVASDVCGQENFVIRLHEDMVYVSYGNMKVKAPISSGSGELFDYKSIINDILSDAFGVKLQLGSFERILKMIRDYSWKDCLTKLALGIDYETDRLQLQISEDLGASKDMLAQIVFNFSDEKLTLIELDALDVVDVKDEQGEIVDTNSLIDAKFSVLSEENSQIAEFDATAYQDYAENYLDGILNSVKVQEDIYAFSSDIAIRYSTTTFYGKLTAMLVAERDNNGEITGYSPAISVETTALGLNSYIYLIDNMLYVDIHGLQLKAELSETTIEEVLEFVEQEFGVSLGEETSNAAETGEALQQTSEAFKVIIPALDDIYGSWVSVVQESDTSYGVQINITDTNNDASERLQYAENAFFYDIVLQAFVDTIKAEDSTQGTIIPTKIVLGANITDANTTPRYEEDYFKDSWLSYGTDDNGNAIVLEDSITKQLNFAVYLTNISMGSTDNLGLNAIFGSDLKEISTLKANREIDWNSEIYSETGILKAETIRTDLKSTSEFNHYQNLLDFADTAYDYAMGMNYQAGMTISITSEEGASTVISGDATVQLSDLTEEQIANNTFVLFGNKALKVQGNLVVENSSKGTLDNKHLIDLLYQSDNDAALYVTYSHDSYVDDTVNDSGRTDNYLNNNIGKNDFKAKIANTNLSEIIAMLLSFAKIDLGEGFEQQLGLDENPSTTDFYFVQQLLNIGVQDISDDTSKVDKYLSSIENIAKMIESVRISKTDANVDGLFETEFVVELNMKHINETENEQVAVIRIVMKEEYIDSDGSITKKLRYLGVEDLIYGTNTINIALNLGDFDAAQFDYVTGEESSAAEEDKHIDFSTLSSFVDVVVNTVNQEEFNYSGNISVSMTGLSVNMGIDLYASLNEKGDLYAYVQFTTTYSGLASIMFSGDFDGRISILELNMYSDNKKTEDVDESEQSQIRIDRYDINKKTERLGFLKYNNYMQTDHASISKTVYMLTELSTSETLTQEQASKNVKQMFIDLFGFSDTILNMIISIVENMEIHPTLEKAILGYSYDASNSKYVLQLNSENIMGMENNSSMSASNMNINLGVTNVSEKYSQIQTTVVEDVQTETVVEKHILIETTKNYSFIDSISTALTLEMISIIKMNISVALNSVSGESYGLYNKIYNQFYSQYSSSNIRGSTIPDYVMYTNNYYRNRYINAFNQRIANEYQALIKNQTEE